MFGLWIGTPLVAYYWLSVVSDVRCRRTGSQPPRLLRGLNRDSATTVFNAALAGEMTLMWTVTTSPWHDSVAHRLATSTPPLVWSGAGIAAFVIPGAVTYLLTRGLPVSSATPADSSG